MNRETLQGQSSRHGVKSIQYLPLILECSPVFMAMKNSAQCLRYSSNVTSVRVSGSHGVDLIELLSDIPLIICLIAT